MKNKQDIADKAGVDVSVVEAVLKAVSDLCLESDSEGVDLKGVCKIEVVMKEAHVGRNPRTGESVNIPAKRQAKAKIARALKLAL